MSLFFHTSESASKGVHSISRSVVVSIRASVRRPGPGMNRGVITLKELGFRLQWRGAGSIPVGRANFTNSPRGIVRGAGKRLETRQSDRPVRRQSLMSRCNRGTTKTPQEPIRDWLLHTLPKPSRGWQQRLEGTETRRVMPLRKVPALCERSGRLAVSKMQSAYVGAVAPNRLQSERQLSAKTAYESVLEDRRVPAPQNFTRQNPSVGIPGISWVPSKGSPGPTQPCHCSETPSTDPTLSDVPKAAWSQRLTAGTVG